jgi:hypothetical protein
MIDPLSAVETFQRAFVVSGIENHENVLNKDKTLSKTNTIFEWYNITIESD